MRRASLTGGTAAIALLAVSAGFAAPASAEDNSEHFAIIKLDGSTYFEPGSGDYTAGDGVTVAVLDSWVKQDHLDLGPIRSFGIEGGTYTRYDRHGTHVAGIIAARDNGTGAQGIAPNADIINYGVFDDNGWVRSTSIRGTLNHAEANGASIANASFGVPGQVITGYELSQIAGSNVLYVKAAGNDGVAAVSPGYSGNLEDLNNLLLVGSTNNAGQLSSFSNRPGEACLVGSSCGEAEKLKYRFLVAPGERIYGLSETGGYARLSGTSMAAPVVAGAAAVVQSRWQWLRDDAGKTAGILLESAQDLGARGVDSTYGYGLLDVEAALQPVGDITVGAPASELKSSNITGARSGHLRDRRDQRRKVRTLLRGSYLRSNGLFNSQALRTTRLSVFDSYGRDFSLDFSNLIASAFNTRGQRRMNARLERLKARALRQEQRQAARAARNANFVEIGSYQSPTLTNQVAGSGLALGFGSLDRFSYTNEAVASGSAAAQALDVNENPLASFADGGAYVQATLDATKQLSFAFASQQSLPQSQVEGGVSSTQFARAFSAESRFKLDETLSLNAGLTQLTEKGTLLGNYGAGAFGFGESVTTNGVKVGINWSPSARFSIDGSYSFAKVNAFSGDGILSSREGLFTDAWVLRFAGRQLLNKNDSLALSVSQPMRVRSGSVVIDNAVVTDRETGAIAYRQDRVELTPDAREIDVSLAYAQDFWAGRGSFEFSASHRFNAGHQRGQNDTTVGASVALAF